MALTTKQGLEVGDWQQDVYSTTQTTRALQSKCPIKGIKLHWDETSNAHGALFPTIYLKHKEPAVDVDLDAGTEPSAAHSVAVPSGAGPAAARRVCLRRKVSLLPLTLSPRH